jgi:hypothetical protein
MLLAVVALLATASVVRCQEEEEEPQVISFGGEPQAEPAAVEEEPIPAATPTPTPAAATPTPTPAAAAGSMDAYKELATEYLNKATETATGACTVLLAAAATITSMTSTQGTWTYACCVPLVLAACALWLQYATAQLQHSGHPFST